MLAYLAMNGKVVQWREKKDGFLPFMALRYISAEGGHDTDPKPWPYTGAGEENIVSDVSGAWMREEGKDILCHG
ncbi:MAG TPA: hypothetical protein VNN62_16730 [Methylomirabilota bacterium]|nr:hypothetical protein [Methylomirabilota bacterium]